MKKFVFAAICTFSLVGFVVAEDLNVTITKVDGKTVTYYKTKVPEGGKKGKAEKDGPALTAKAAAKVAILKGVPDPDNKGMLKDGDAIESGLSNDLFKNASEDMPVNARITIADSGADKGMITKILQKGGKKGGGKKGG